MEVAHLPLFCDAFEQRTCYGQANVMTDLTKSNAGRITPHKNHCRNRWRACICCGHMNDGDREVHDCSCLASSIVCVLCVVEQTNCFTCHAWNVLFTEAIGSICVRVCFREMRITRVHQYMRYKKQDVVDDPHRLSTVDSVYIFSASTAVSIFGQNWNLCCHRHHRLRRRY